MAVRSQVRFTVERRTQPSNQPTTVHTELCEPEHAGKRYLELLDEHPGAKVKQTPVPLGEA